MSVLNNDGGDDGGIPIDTGTLSDNAAEWKMDERWDKTDSEVVGDRDMLTFKTNDNCQIAYQDIGSPSLPPLILVSPLRSSRRTALTAP
jgi:hypothetical protein